MKLAVVALTVLLSACATVSGGRPIEVVRREAGCTVFRPSGPRPNENFVLFGFEGAAASGFDEALARHWAGQGFSVVATPEGGPASLAACYRVFWPYQPNAGRGPLAAYVVAGLDAAPGNAGAAARGMMIASHMEVDRLAAGVHPAGLRATDATMLLLTEGVAAPPPAVTAQFSGVGARGLWASRMGRLSPDDVMTVSTAFLIYTTHPFAKRDLMQGDEWFHGPSCRLCLSPDWAVWKSANWWGSAPSS